jgi:hypothetical protein
MIRTLGTMIATLIYAWITLVFCTSVMDKHGHRALVNADFHASQALWITIAVLVVFASGMLYQADAS